MMLFRLMVVLVLLAGPLRLESSQKTEVESHALRVTSDFLDVRISLDYPGFTGLALDSLGKEHFPLIPIRQVAPSTNSVRGVIHGSCVDYRREGRSEEGAPQWTIKVDGKDIVLQSNWSPDDPPESLTVDADPTVCHGTLLGRIQADGSIDLPAIFHLPDYGSFRISADSPQNLGYDASLAAPRFVKVTFPPATRTEPKITYRWEAVAIHPKISGVSDARFDGFRRNWLNIFQINPRRRVLANHAASDSCAFCYYEYADIAAHTPPLGIDVSADDMVAQTLDAIFGGAKAYGMPGYGDFPEFSSDTYPSLLIAAEGCVASSKSNAWLAENYTRLKSWTEKMLATRHAGDGLIEYSMSGNSGSWPPKLVNRPANWWDTIGFGHNDAYANALAYRALKGMAELARRQNHLDDQARYLDAAERLHSTYYDTFFDPATGVLAGWKSSDGQLHDYYFPWVNGIAIHYGLVPRNKANSIMDHLLAKMKEVGYMRFDLGLPGNLVPVAQKDYVTPEHRWGGSQKQDGSDGFQIYENGGATASFAYFTLAALYDLGRIEEADKMLFPMLEAFNRGDFQGHCDNGMSKDWKTWDGTCWGYEGFLVDNYYALLAVVDREAAVKRGGKPVPSW